jgi:hypothetical protein
MNLREAKRRSCLSQLFVQFAEHSYSRQIDIGRRGEIDHHEVDGVILMHPFQ